jgi:hypothetical protein
MASSRVFLLLALVAVLLCGAFAQKTTKNYGSKSAKFAAKKCLKAAGAGCKVCTDEDEDGTFECSECKTGYTFDANDRCVCDVDQDYGRVTKAQIKANKNKGGYKVSGYGKHAKHGNCVDCSLFGLEAELNDNDVSVCVEPLTEP